MSRTQTTLAALLVLLAVAAPQWIVAQAPKEPAAAEEGEESKSRGRLPNLYGKLGVSEVQRERIYAIQGEYNAKIDDLLAQVEELRGERDKAMEAGCSDYDTKPVELPRLLAKMTALLGEPG